MKIIAGPLGIILGLLCGKRIYPLLTPYFGEKVMVKIAIFLIVTILVAFLVIILGKIFSKVLHNIFLGWLDSLLGALFGLILTFLLCGFSLQLLVLFWPKARPAIEGSGLARRVLTFWLIVPLPKPKGIEKERKPPDKPKLVTSFHQKNPSFLKERVA